ncbi:receptor-type adenylate cyclase GRESAG 4, putative [Trypanosoma brucei brucei TREU927]|uniref:adenylate cyclase n=1 Tax=Trypanosoma brucei brucei (strain 927/4 GUTat10.1) TaxID=185431 RepID=Q57TY4_TRYB2|nr:receptor-type adenylate cyclase GRESAG 4, putative [Trypanosoma brucei brucei TREU927]AAX79972.1 receptor-type adenylate cyclase GRESAG 4, putative [Trypanosoma brucei]AAZ12808.1 receptor-type adenylate cyclase GRESAG 4, putative [Trypanosoma brucei brucei TREU927]
MKAPALLLFLLSACAASPPTREAGGVQVTVTVLSLLYSKNWPVEYINAVNAGFNASLAARGWVMAPGVDVSVVRPPSYNTPAHEYLKEYLRGLEDDNNLLVVLGPMGEESTSSSYDTLEEHTLVGFAPMTGAAGFEAYRPNLYFLRPELTGELIALIRYAVNYLRVLRLGFMYLEGSMGGSATYEKAVFFLSRLGYEPCCAFTVQSHEGDQGISAAEFEAAWKEFAANRPQAVILLTTMKEETEKFIKKLVADPRTADAFLLAPSLMQKSIASVWKEALEEANAPFVPRRVIQTGTNPLAVDGFFAAIKRFQTEMRNYLTEYKEWSGFNDADHFLKNDADGELMVNGWIAGEVLARALRSHGWMNNGTAFLESLYEQRRYVIDDIVIGDFGGECSERAVGSGAICHCNHGGRKVYMKEVAEDYRLRPVLGGYTVQSPLECNSDPAILQPPLSGVLVSVEDHPELERATDQFNKGASAVASTGRVGDMNRFFLQKIATDMQNAPGDVDAQRQNRAVSAIFGVVTEATLGLRDLTFIDPITPTPHLNSFSRNVIHLSPTLEQQLYVLVNYLSNIHVGAVSCIIRCEQAPMVKNVLKKTLFTFGLNLSSTVVLTPGDSVGEHLPKSGSTFIIGLAVDDIVVIEEHLRIHTKARVLVQFSDIALLYNEFVQAFNNSDGAKHLLFATSLPHWADVNTTSETVRRFHEAVREVEKWTPLSLLGFATGRLMQRNLQRMDLATSDLLSGLFFNETFITVDDMQYGAYKDAEGVATAEESLSNFGATDISVWSMARALRSDEPVLQDPMSPSMVYTVPNNNALTPAQLAGVVGAGLLVLILAVGLTVFLCCIMRNKRDNDNAPKELADPVTLIFTDIESSTAQWATQPELMPDAVATHHSMVRSLIENYDCYEVKTVGDSFMIACKSPFAAVHLAQELQRRFLHHDWGTTVFDEFYREFEERHAEEGDGKYKPPTARLDPEVYRQLWNGLRVRVGIHTGLCDIRYDEVTKGYDYYGQTANTAARTESVGNGGQVLMTCETYHSLSTEERSQFDVTPLGGVPLRGVSEPVEVYQLNAVPGRSFAELRLDRVLDVLDIFGEGTAASTSDYSSTLAELSETAQAIAVSLQSLMGVFTQAQRQGTLMPFCERWRVPLPKKSASAWDDSYCEEVVRRIAMKVGHVVDYHAVVESEHSSSTLSSGSVLIISNHVGELGDF